MKLSGKVAIVTGSGRGLGKAMALKFASEGAAVVVCARTIEKVHQVVDEIKNQGGTALAVRTDVTNKADVHNLVKSTLEKFKAVHILVNNAGIEARIAPLLEVTEEEWDAAQDVHLKGVFNCTQAVLGHMMEQRYGKIINISANIPFGDSCSSENSVSVHVAKVGVDQLTKTTAMVGGPYGINVNSIAPGMIPHDVEAVYTELGGKEAGERFLEERKKKAALGRVGKPEDIANLALFLASDDSSFITGQVINCDGGRHDHM